MGKGQREEEIFTLDLRAEVMVQLVSLLQMGFFCHSYTASVFDTKEGNNS